MISLAILEKTAELISSEILHTPCIYSSALSEYFQKDIYLKLECFQHTNAFKIRGNAAKFLKFKKNLGIKGVVTASSGNHGQGLSLMSKRTGLPATIIVPEITPLNKIEKIKKNGANLIIHGNSYDQASSYAHELADKEGLLYVSSFDDLDIIAGNSSMGLEIMDAVPDAKTIICPIGGGGGISGIAMACKQIKPDIKIIGVEVEGFDSMKKSIEADCLVKTAGAKTNADGIAVMQPGIQSFEIARKMVDSFVTVTEQSLYQAVFMLAEKAKIVAEFAGSAPIASLLDDRFLAGIDDPIVCVVTGGNIDMSTLLGVLKNGLSQG